MAKGSIARSDVAEVGTRQALEKERVSLEKLAARAFRLRSKGDLLVGTPGERDAALRAYREAIPFFEELVAYIPPLRKLAPGEISTLPISFFTMHDWKSGLVDTHRKIAEALAASGEYDAAVGTYRKMLPIYEKLQAIDHACLDWWQEPDYVHALIGDLLAAEGDHEGAILAYRKALARPKRGDEDRSDIEKRLAALAKRRPQQRQESDLVSRETVYTNNASSSEGADTAQLPMGKQETIDEFAARKGMTVAQLEEAANNWQAAGGEVAERDTTARAEGKLRLQVTPSAATEAHAAAQVITREMLGGSVPPSLQTDGRQKYEFADELFSDPKVIKREESIANRMSYRVRHKKPLSDGDRARGNVAKAFLGQLRTRQQHLG